jgi:hypothetical protein
MNGTHEAKAAAIRKTGERSMFTIRSYVGATLEFGMQRGQPDSDVRANQEKQNLSPALASGVPCSLPKADLPDKHDVVIDQRIVTTMFLPSSAIVAQEMIDLLR